MTLNDIEDIEIFLKLNKKLHKLLLPKFEKKILSTMIKEYLNNNLTVINAEEKPLENISI